MKILTQQIVKEYVFGSVARFLSSKVPQKPVYSVTEKHSLPPETKIDQNTIELLERLSLVDFANERGIEQLEEAIRFADQIRLVDTTDVDPLITVLDMSLYLRDDKVTEGNLRKDVMANASVTEEEYFVAPTGNVPFTPRYKKSEE
ncbi:glutamyl-tRNA(Gln) amidotransferase subunit C, mitochondrial [Schistocerca piceifrons]|uniref:glutamyl-tRNA(Gln) amidotransferase subunit C, mitochondrial n=1 Tax=Schistocerca piceifrons TaxID=274613 RepID=UPI001F5F84D9|nr:glutamyl-tRNA(Gln) amidotransferase subunit C, mitochondrial [Schistocerca piceifrons]